MGQKSWLFDKILMCLIDSCPCCGSKELRRWPAIVSPFIASYACGTKPGDSHLCECEGCSFRFFDTRLTDAEVAKLYAGYRGDAYFKARHHYEFWYSREVNDGIGSDPVEIVSRKQNLAKQSCSATERNRSRRCWTMVAIAGSSFPMVLGASASSTKFRM
jgi:hypothetical protein